MEQYIQVMERRNIDELILIDIEATNKGVKPNFRQLRRFCDNLYCPVTYGGGIHSLDDIKEALNNGADKVAVRNKPLMKQASEKFGAQCIVAVWEEDATRVTSDEIEENLDWYHLNGVGEILLVDTLLDGTMEGYSLHLIKMVSEISNIPIIACGGCGEPVHMLQALEAGASAVAAGSMFLYTEHTPRSCAEELTQWGQDVRLV